MATFTHDEKIFLARLLTNHIVGEFPAVVQSITDKLLDYAENTTGDYETDPLILRQALHSGDDRFVFAIDNLRKGV